MSAIELQEKLDALIRRSQILESKIKHLPGRKLSSDGKKRLLKLVNGESSFLDKLNSSLTIQTSQLSSTNLTHIEAAVEAMSHPLLSNIIAINYHQDIEVATGETYPIHVDAVGMFNGLPAWLVIRCTQDEAIVSSSKNQKSTSVRIKNLLVAAAATPCQRRPRLIIFWFTKGFSQSKIEILQAEFSCNPFSVLDSVNNLTGDAILSSISTENDWTVVNWLKEVGIDCSSEISTENCWRNGTWLSIPVMDNLLVNSGTEAPLESSMAATTCLQQYVNLDTTALMAMVSQLSNGAVLTLCKKSDKELQARFPAMWKFVKDQLESEAADPLVAEMEQIMAGRQPIVCQTVVTEFESIISTVAGPMEKQRAADLIKALRVVEDTPSERILQLPCTGRIKQKLKVIMGTGDHWGCPTLTANMSFVRAVQQAHVPLSVIQHRPRALIGE